MSNTNAAFLASKNPPKVDRFLSVNAIFLTILLFVLSVQLSYSQWQTEIRLTNDPHYSIPGTLSIAANGSTIHAVWCDNRDGNYEIYYKRSTDAGASWGADTRLTSDTALSIHPTISVSGLFVNITWDDKRDGIFKVYYKRSTDGGISWDADVLLTIDAASSYHYPSIASSGSNLHVVWFDWRTGDAEIFYKNSTDNGNTWSADTHLSNTVGLSFMPVVAVSGANIHVAWYDSTNGNWEIYYKRSTDNGTTWGTDSRITNNSADSKWPSIAVSGSIVHVAWTDNRNGPLSIFYKRSTNGGTSWGSDIAMIKHNAYGIYPCLAVNGSNVHLVYQSVSDIFYNTSANNGATWGNVAQLTNNPSSSSYSSIAVSGTALHVIFMDNRDGNNEIYYKRNLTGLGRPTVITNTNSELPNEFSLSQNYPNPFNPSTKIKFALPNNSFAKLVVYDALGRELETLVNEQLNAGTYEAVWSADKFSSGVYYYKITAGNYSQTNKMILIK